MIALRPSHLIRSRVRDFDKCTTLFKNFPAQDKINRVERLVAKVGLEDGVNLSYVPKDEWNKLSQSEKDKINVGRKAWKASRSAKGRDKGGGGGRNGNKAKSKDKKSKWKDKCGINKLVKKAVDRQVKALLSKKATGDDNESDEDEGMNDATHNIRQLAKKKKKSGDN